MTTTDWIIDITLVLIVLRQLHEEKLTARFIAIPAAIVFFTARTYLHGLPSGGNDLVLVVLCLVAGSLLGLAGGLLTKVRARDGAAHVQAGPAAAALWVASMGARLGFIIWITHSAGSAALTRFSIQHHITGAQTWQTALVLLALSEVVVRLGLIVIRARLAVTSRPATTSELQSVTV